MVWQVNITDTLNKTLNLLATMVFFNLSH